MFNDFAYTSWGEKSNAATYDNIGDFFQGGNIFDESASVAGGTKNSKFYLSGSYYDQVGVVPETGYKKYAFRFNGEQKVGIFTFHVSAAYSDAHTAVSYTHLDVYTRQSLLRAINIEPILVRTPGHMFVGYYTDSSHKDMNFLETTMIGDVDLDDFFPDEQLDSTMVGRCV